MVSSVYGHSNLPNGKYKIKLFSPVSDLLQTGREDLKSFGKVGMGVFA